MERGAKPPRLRTRLRSAKRPARGRVSRAKAIALSAASAVALTATLMPTAVARGAVVGHSKPAPQHIAGVTGVSISKFLYDGDGANVVVSGSTKSSTKDKPFVYKEELYANNDSTYGHYMSNDSTRTGVNVTFALKCFPYGRMMKPGESGVVGQSVTTWGGTPIGSTKYVVVGYPYKNGPEMSLGGLSSFTTSWPGQVSATWKPDSTITIRLIDTSKGQDALLKVLIQGPGQKTATVYGHEQGKGTLTVNFKPTKDGTYIITAHTYGVHNFTETVKVG